MSGRTAFAVLASIALLAAAAGGGYWYALNRATPTTHGNPKAGQGAADADNKSNPERAVLYWHDPMFPQHKFDKPGKSPFMDMQLEPVYAGEVQGGNININPALAQSLGMRSTEVKMGTFSRRVDTVGTVQADERRISVLQSRASGWIEKLHLRALNDPVRRGMPVAEIYAPELLVAQEEYLLLLKGGKRDAVLADAARDRLSLLGFTESQIQVLERLREPTRRVVLNAPSSGIVTELGAREGAAVSPGMPVASIVDLSRVWIVAQVPEMQLGLIATGQSAEARLGAMPGDLYEGQVEYVYPDVDPTTRTVKVRFSVQNKNLRLRPGMIANVTVFGGPKRETLMVPSEAIIRTGNRSVVIVEEAQGRFRAQEIALGLDSGDEIEVTAGLTAGERVVVSGQFLIDSEASLKGAINRLTPEKSTADSLNAQTDRGEHVAEGTVMSVDAAAGKVVISHGPVATLDWPSMTMGFAVSDRALLDSLKPKDEIEFRFIEGANGFEITAANRKNGGGKS